MSSLLKHKREKQRKFFAGAVFGLLAGSLSAFLMGYPFFETFNDKPILTERLEIHLQRSVERRSGRALCLPRVHHYLVLRFGHVAVESAILNPTLFVEPPRRTFGYPERRVIKHDKKTPL